MQLAWYTPSSELRYGSRTSGPAFRQTPSRGTVASRQQASALQGETAQIRIVDRSTQAWGHILADHFVFSDEPLTALRTGDGNAIADDPQRVQLLQDFEGADYGPWVGEPPVYCCDDAQ